MRDISNASKRAPLRPDYIAIFCHQFASQASGLAQDATVGWLAPPFGFAAPPAIFAMCTDAIQRVHRSGRALDGSWSGWGAFWSVIFAGDAIFVEADVGDFLQETVDAWELACPGLFGPDSINGDTVRLGGKWDTSGLILGFGIDTVEETIAVPPPKVDGARTYLLSDEFVAGSQHVTLKALQTLRGYMQHWLVSSMFWASFVQLVDLLLTYGSEDCATASCPNLQIWSGYWDMLSLLGNLSQDEVAWPTLFGNSLIRTVALSRRFPGPGILEEVSRITTDATPSIIGVADWRDRTYIRVDAESNVRNYVEQDGLHAGIEEEELMGLVLGSVAGFPDHPGAAPFIGVGNSSATS